MEAALIALALLWHSNSSEIDRRSTGDRPVSLVPPGVPDDAFKVPV